MAGTLFGLSLSQQFDENGDPLAGNLLYLFEAHTSTPVDSFAEDGLVTLNTNPLEADASGRIPQFWLEDGSYRARLTTAQGVEVFDIASILAIGPSTGSSGGGGSGSVDETAIFGVGDMKWKPIAGSITGWVRANGRTIGSAASGATERANADTQALYEFLYNNFPDSLCPVTLGRGVSAASDFTANKAIGTLDMRGSAGFGLDDMGNLPAGVLTDGTPTTAGSAVGAETATLSEDNLPSHSHTFSGVTTTDGTHTHNVGAARESGQSAAGTGSDRALNQNVTADANGAHTHSFSGETDETGDGNSFNKMPPGRLGSWYIKL